MDYHLIRGGSSNTLNNYMLWNPKTSATHSIITLDCGKDVRFTRSTSLVLIYLLL